jgi:hypothetical protein
MSQQKRVWIHRVEPNNGNLPEDVRKNAKRRLSSVYKNRKPLKGLNPEEEKEILPRIIDASPEEGSTFYEKASTFWKELTIDVPSGGKSLNISTHESDEDNIPQPAYPEDYVFYRFAKAHPQVADSKEEAISNRNKLYWILDPEEEKRSKRHTVEEKAKAWEEFIKMKDNEEKVNLMVRVFTNENPDNMPDIDDKINLLNDELERRPKRFVQLAQDDDLEKQDFVLQCLEYGVLRKVGDYIMYNDEEIGRNIEEAVTHLKSKRNTSTLSELKAKLSQAKG